MIDKWTLDQTLTVAQREIARQDETYGPFSSAVPSARLAIACLEDEVREARQEWEQWKRNPDWWRSRSCQSLRQEAIQVAAIALRLARGLEVRIVD